MLPPTADRLLSGRDSLSVREKEEIFGRVLRAMAPARRRRRFGWIGGLVLGSATAMALLLWPQQPELDGQGFTSRGAGGVTFAIGCPAGVCRVGGELHFEYDAAPAGSYFAARARREDGAIIWYFPAGTTVTSVPLAGSSGFLQRAVVLGPEHTPGEYVIEGVFSRRALDRDAVRDVLEGNATSDDVTVVRRRLRVE